MYSIEVKTLLEHSSNLYFVHLELQMPPCNNAWQLSTTLMLVCLPLNCVIVINLDTHMTILCDCNAIINFSTVTITLFLQKNSLEDGIYLFYQPHIHICCECILLFLFIIWSSLVFAGKWMKLECSLILLCQYWHHLLLKANRITMLIATQSDFSLILYSMMQNSPRFYPTLTHIHLETKN
jgi:hypothetical protein